MSNNGKKSHAVRGNILYASFFILAVISWNWWMFSIIGKRVMMMPEVHYKDAQQVIAQMVFSLVIGNAVIAILIVSRFIKRKVNRYEKG